MDKQTVEAIGNEVRKTGKSYFKVAIPICIASLVVLIALIVFVVTWMGATFDKVQDQTAETAAKAMEQTEEMNAELMAEARK